MTRIRTDSFKLHTGKKLLFSAHIRILFVLLLLRQCRGAAATTSAPRSSTCENNDRRRGNRPIYRDQVPATHNGRCRGQRPGHHAQLPARRRGQQPGATVKYLRRTTSATAGNGLGTRINNTQPCDAQRAQPRATA